MVSMLVLVALGVSLLGGGYLSLRDTRLKNQLMVKHTEIAEKISVQVPIFTDDAIQTEKDEYALIQLHEYLLKNKFSREYEDDYTKHDYYAYLENRDTGEVRWQSKFMDAAPNEVGAGAIDQSDLINQFVISEDKDRAVGEPLLQERFLRYFDGEQNQVHRYIVYSELVKADEEMLRLVIAQSASQMHDDSDHVQKNIIALFFSTLALVLVSQLISNYFIITPIRDFEDEVRQIEAGAKKAMEKAYPVELMEVKSAINTLINVEKGQKKRYRESMENLAHSLKTPLSGLLSHAETKYQMKRGDQEDLMNAIQHMSDIVAYQLKRAVVRSPNSMVELVALRPVLYRLRDSLYKVYHEKDFEIVINVDEYDKVRLESDDLIELFGNLINNACRFCNDIVNVTTTSETNYLIVDIDDDGMGFGVDSPSELLKRGMRDDSKTEGQGIGLAISAEIVEAVGGKIELKASPQVGARVRLFLPH